MKGQESPERTNKNSEEGDESEVSNLRVYNEQQNGQNNQILHNSKTLQPAFIVLRLKAESRALIQRA